MSAIEEKVDRLEEAREKFTINVNVEFNKALINLLSLSQIEMMKRRKKFEQDIKEGEIKWHGEIELGTGGISLGNRETRTYKRCNLRCGELANRFVTMRKDIVKGYEF